MRIHLKKGETTICIVILFSPLFISSLTWAEERVEPFESLKAGVVACLREIESDSTANKSENKLRLLENKYQVNSDASNKLKSLGWEYCFGDWKLCREEESKFKVSNGILLSIDKQVVKTGLEIDSAVVIEHFVGFIDGKEVQPVVLPKGCVTDALVDSAGRTTPANGFGYRWEGLKCNVSHFPRSLLVGEQFSAEPIWSKPFEIKQMRSRTTEISVNQNGLKIAPDDGRVWPIESKFTGRRGAVILFVKGEAIVGEPYVEVDKIKVNRMRQFVAVADTKVQTVKKNIILFWGEANSTNSFSELCSAKSETANGLELNWLLTPTELTDFLKLGPEDNKLWIDICTKIISNIRERDVNSILLEKDDAKAKVILQSLCPLSNDSLKHTAPSPIPPPTPPSSNEPKDK